MHDRVVNTRHADTTAPKPLRFDRYLLDLNRGCLVLDDNEIALRPKTFAVLHFLVENCGRLISKEELFAAVWPDIAVTDDALVQSVGELRRALGDDGPRLIRTVPRRGYRFESDVSPVVSNGRSSADAALISPASSDVAHSSEPAIARVPFTLFAGSRVRWLASVAFAFLVGAVVLWSGTATEWKFPNILGHAGQSTTKTAESGSKPVIAILPFLNESDDTAREYFADGLTQDVIDALGRFSGLTVMSWNAVLPYRGKSLSPGEIARSLAVRYQVEGRVRQAGDRIRVTAQLVDRDGHVLWSTRFDEALVDLFSLQDKLTTQIAQALTVRVTQIEQRRVFAKPTKNLEAYDYVLRARPALQHPMRADVVKARAALRRAIELDPNYAAAYAALAETYFTSVSMGWVESPTEFLARAEEMANKSLSIDDTEVRARVVLGRIDIFYHRYEQAQVEMDRAIAINPNDAHGLAGRGNALMWLGQIDAAIEALEQAQRIDPELNPMDRFALSLAYYLKRRYDAAIDQAELNLRQTPGANFSRIVLAAAYAQDNQIAAAARVVTEVRHLDPTFDPQEYGTKFLNPIDLENLRDGLRKAGLFPAAAGPGSDH